MGEIKTFRILLSLVARRWMVLCFGATRVLVGMCAPDVLAVFDDWCMRAKYVLRPPTAYISHVRKCQFDWIMHSRRRWYFFDSRKHTRHTESMVEVCAEDDKRSEEKNLSRRRCEAVAINANTQNRCEISKWCPPPLRPLCGRKGITMKNSS